MVNVDAKCVELKHANNREEIEIVTTIKRDLVDIEVLEVGHWYQKFEEDYPNSAIAVIEVTRGGIRQTPIFLSMAVPIIAIRSLCAGLKEGD